MYIKLQRKWRDKGSGFILINALLLMFVASLLIWPALWATTTMLTVNLDALQHAKAYYAAKAGIADVYHKFQDPNYSFSAYSLGGNPINGMTVTVAQIPGTTVITNGTVKTYPLQSTAKLPNGTTLSTVYSIIEVDYVSGYPFRYAVASTGGDIDLSSANIEVSSPNKKADVFANGALKVSTTGSTSVTGTGYYTSTPAPDCSKVTNGCQQSATITLETLDETYYLGEAQNGKRYPDCGSSCPSLSLPLNSPFGVGTYTTSNGQILGSKAGPGYISYIDGNLIISGSVTLKGTLWVNGNITVNGSITTPGYGTTSPYQCYLLSHGTASAPHEIKFYSGARIMANYDLSLINDYGTVWSDNNVRGPGGASDPGLMGVIYCPNGAVDLSNNVRIVLGAVIGQSVKLSNNVTIHYNENFLSNPIDGFLLNGTTVSMKGYSGM